MHRVTAALPVLREQLSADELLPFLAFVDDPPLFTAEVMAAHHRGQVTLPPEVLRILGAAFSQPLDPSDDPGSDLL